MRYQISAPSDPPRLAWLVGSHGHLVEVTNERHIPGGDACEVRKSTASPEWIHALTSWTAATYGLDFNGPFPVLPELREGPRLTEDHVQCPTCRKPVGMYSEQDSKIVCSSPVCGAITEVASSSMQGSSCENAQPLTVSVGGLTYSPPRAELFAGAGQGTSHVPEERARQRRATLNTSGWNFSRREKAWQRQLTDNAILSGEALLRIKIERGEGKGR